MPPQFHDPAIVGTQYPQHVPQTSQAQGLSQQPTATSAPAAAVQEKAGKNLEKAKQPEAPVASARKEAPQQQVVEPPKREAPKEVSIEKAVEKARVDQRRQEKEQEKVSSEQSSALISDDVESIRKKTEELSMKRDVGITGRGGQRSRGGRPHGPKKNIVAEVRAAGDFDFEASNALFSKEDAPKDEEEVPAVPVVAYNKSSSFFDSLSSDLTDRGVKSAHKRITALFMLYHRSVPQESPFRSKERLISIRLVKQVSGGGEEEEEDEGAGAIGAEVDAAEEEGEEEVASLRIKLRKAADAM